MRILYLDIDSMRPDHFSCAGYGRNTTPNMDRIAAGGVRFNRCYVNGSPCVPARASFVSGRFAIHHGALTHWGPGGQFRGPTEGDSSWADAPLLPRYLREHGYRTVTFSSFADRHRAWWFSGGWTGTHTPTMKRGNEDADEVIDAVLPWLAGNARSDDWFLHVQLWDPHRDYTVGQAWIDLVASDPPPDWPDAEAIAGHQANPGPFTASELFPVAGGRSPVATMPDRIAGVDDWTRFVDGYDGAIRFMDDQIGRVIGALDAAGVLDDTAIVISADHGEAMGEHGVYGDHVCAGESVHNIPMIVRWPGAARGQVHDGLLYGLDFHPTLCDLLGIPIPPGWDGRSFAPAVRGEAWNGRPCLIFDHALYTVQRAVRTPDWSLIRTYHPGLFPFEDLMLFDMRRDIRQTTNLAADRPDVVADLDHLMQTWLHEAVGHPGARPDPMPEVIRTGPWKYVQPGPWLTRLRAEGRDDDADAIQRVLDRHG